MEKSHSKSCGSSSCQLREYNLAVRGFIEQGIFAFVFAEDKCAVPPSCKGLPIFRIGNSLSHVLAMLLGQVDKFPFFRFRLKIKAKRRFNNRVWYWGFRAFGKDWLAEIELIAESSCVWRIWTTPSR
jgi:hypothetical protein